MPNCQLFFVLWSGLCKITSRKTAFVSADGEEPEIVTDTTIKCYILSIQVHMGPWGLRRSPWTTKFLVWVRLRTFPISLSYHFVSSLHCVRTNKDTRMTKNPAVYSFSWVSLQEDKSVCSWSVCNFDRVRYQKPNPASCVLSFSFTEHLTEIPGRLTQKRLNMNNLNSTKIRLCLNQLPFLP